MSSTETIKITVTCIECGKTYELFVLKDSYDEYIANTSGRTVQEIFPNISCDDRELFFISNICGTCWNDMFTDDDDDADEDEDDTMVDGKHVENNKISATLNGDDMNDIIEAATGLVTTLDPAIRYTIRLESAFHDYYVSTEQGVYQFSDQLSSEEFESLWDKVSQNQN